MKLTANENDLMKHTAGYPKMNRNHFAAGEDHADFSALESLVKKGCMKKRKAADWMGGGWIFHATETGIKQIKG